MEDVEQSLDPSQFGNRKGRSTSHYLVNLVQFVLGDAEQGRHTNLLTIDYSKAFDKVDTNIAIQKLLQMHVRPELLPWPWISDFLSNRQQRVRLGKTTSQWSTITFGVPQGTKVGPVVFLAMVNDVASAAPFKWKYMWMTSPLGNLDPVTRLHQVAACLALSTISAARLPVITWPWMFPSVVWCSLALAGTLRPLHRSLPTIKPLITSMTLLGLTISPSLNWDTLVKKKKVSKANTKRYFLVVLRRAGTSLEQLVKFYTTFIRPGLEYAAPVWHPDLSQQLSDIIERVQRSSLHIVYPDLSYGRTLEETRLPTLHARREQLCLGFAQSLYANDQFDWFPPQHQSLHGRNLSNKSAINMPRCKTNRTRSSPICYLARLLNNS